MPNASRAMASFSSASACLFLRNLAEKAFWIFSATVLAAEHARSSSKPGREEAELGWGVYVCLCDRCIRFPVRGGLELLPLRQSTDAVDQTSGTVTRRHNTMQKRDVRSDAAVA